MGAKGLVSGEEFVESVEKDFGGMAKTKRCFGSILKVWCRNSDILIPLFLKSTSKTERKGTNR